MRVSHSGIRKRKSNYLRFGNDTHSLSADTIISSFPRRWGKNKPDPSAVHKRLRARLQFARKGEIRSAFDLALIIVDECSRVFFDRTLTNDRQPNLIDIFAEAIKGVVSRDEKEPENIVNSV